MNLGGLEKVSLIDYPNKLAAVVFTQGCNFRCPFCYNPSLINIQKSSENIISEEDIFVFLNNRVGKLEAVVISGGEPTIQKDLHDFIQKIKNLGFLVKLDTNGSNPETLEELIRKEMLDYIAMDLKASKDKYNQLTGIEVNFQKIEESIKLIKDSNIDYEFRSTLVPNFLEMDDINKMGKLIQGTEKWCLQNFKSNMDLLDKDLIDQESFSGSDMQKMKKIAEKHVNLVEIR